MMMQNAQMHQMVMQKMMLNDLGMKNDQGRGCQTSRHGCHGSHGCAPRIVPVGFTQTR